MRLNYAYKELSNLLANTETEHDAVITSVAFDTRRIANGEGVLFFALKGSFRDGHDFLKDAFDKGVRHFVVSQDNIIASFKGAQAIVVEDPLVALWKLAGHHRRKYSFPVIAITGSYGKTIVKEWLSQLLSIKYKVSKSPKSYNSSIGVPLSLLELSNSTEVAIIEVGVPEAGEMKKLKNLVLPTHGILTSFGMAHRSFFSSEGEHLQEKLILFEELETFYYPDNIDINSEKGTAISPNDYHEYLNGTDFKNVDQQNAALAIAMAVEFKVEPQEIYSRIQKLKPLALRLETFEGIDGNIIINDTYSLNEDSLRLSLEYQLAHSKNKNRIVIVGLTNEDGIDEESIRTLVDPFAPDGLFFFRPNDETPEYNFSNSVILLKGSRSSKMETLASEFKKKMHRTYLEIDLKAIRNNINYHKSRLESGTMLLCMIKAASYGADAKRMGLFLEELGVDYLGVAYADEGMELRENGIKVPILVMNCEEESFHQCLEFNLEPAIYSLRQLDSFISFLLKNSMVNFPIHLKLETGMNRLGFEETELNELINLIKGQPEVLIKSVYSHLATSDEKESSFVEEQVASFERMAQKISSEYSQPILRHILNSTGIINYPDAQFEMVRLGIGMYGVHDQSGFESAIRWYSSVSQLKKIEIGESVGYGRSFVANSPMTIAVVAVGYADGFRRSLGNGKGGVFIGDRYCKTVGNVCMDMIMVDVTNIEVNEGDQVEILGKNQSFMEFSTLLNTIPYEVMTSFSERTPRVFVDI